MLTVNNMRHALKEAKNTEVVPGIGDDVPFILSSYWFELFDNPNEEDSLSEIEETRQSHPSAGQLNYNKISYVSGNRISQLNVRQKCD
ncbi:hypothetical protein HPP92_009748 [Vanilla planifolia]|uniref:Uncharacterized protein n=1 Tax=Vanilla planifolia TaxID=51239 RepID=A0A835RB66_VANPL|nr:hypothetical protein HPP92_009748 [Vanilla planifolia]